MGDETFDNTRGMDITRETISLNYYISIYWKIEIFEADLRPIERDVEGMCEDSEDTKEQYRRVIILMEYSGAK